ncbi:TIGR03364 family FAD-dependent oxidoreductase [Rhodococcus sp. HNM0569]|uniref:TIGR03364 family FAD-dependent oxidoreductase n=1 Tax=Rhodococcus sp. HNM0569 TaxID=2716340 RepID=UPI00146B64E5|nr:TIGR03364 family FAD-dependent oxidoreductase [Rhodococcus sp. HNM0569]NLU84515.1 TIGR03364 family FAD-dependent oxidoreductase [Rhodococcus sp. HNM0569]
MAAQRNYDLAVVGAGIVGLAHAYHAHRRGLRVAVVEQNDGVVGASVQNFGHACITAQSGRALEYARAGRRHWLDLARSADFWAAEAGTWCVARRDDELAVMTEFAAERDDEAVRLLSRDEILDRVPVADPATAGGMYLPFDLQIDPRAAAPAIARWLEAEGVDFHWHTAALGFETGRIRTSRGELSATHVVIATNYDVDRLFPALADGLVRCRLHMLRARVALPRPLPGPLFTGWSLVRYSGFENLPSTPDLAQRLAVEHPDEVALDLHQMYTPQRDGTILVGDTHARDVSPVPFQSEDGFRVLLDETRRLFGSDIEVIERWQGVYSSAPDREFLIAEPLDRVHVVTVTTGIGMTTSMGLAADTVARIAATVAA